MKIFQCTLLILAAATALSFLSSTAHAQLEIKGIQVDRQADCEYIRSLETRSGTFADSCRNRYTQGFTTVVSFLDGKADLVTYQSSDGVVTMILVSNFDFEKALASFTAKFGEPRIAKSSVQNRVGAVFEQMEAVWRDEKTTLRLAKHGGTVGQPLLTLSGEEMLKVMEKRLKPSPNI